MTRQHRVEGQGGAILGAGSSARRLLPAAFALAACAGVAAANPLSDANAGLEALRAGNDAEAVSLFTRALNSGGLSRSDRELAYAKRAQAYEAEHNKDAALADLDQALKLAPADQEALDLREALNPQSGPSLQATLEFISGEIARQVQINVTYIMHDSTKNNDTTFRFSIDPVAFYADSANCKIEAKYAFIFNNTSENKGVKVPRDDRVRLSDVRSISIYTLSQGAFINLTNPALTARVNHDVFAVKIDGGRDNSGDLGFSDEDVANRVAKAMRHAARLCGGLKVPVF